jgi:drug/metabolite transporter (DMT)-like permease
MATASIVLASEAALALYPILIKTVPTNLGTQLLSRILVYSGLAYFLATESDVSMTWGNLSGALRSTCLGALTLLHIGSSYYAFQELPAGVSMSLFYTYPLWNLVGAAIGFGETFDWSQWLFVLLGFVGVVLIAVGNRDPDPQKQKDPYTWKGLVAALTAALTESAMYFAVRTAQRPSPFYAVLELYPAALLFLLPLLWSFKQSVDVRPGVWARMISFNTLIGFLGYCLRFYAIPRISTFAFSLLSFVGVVASFGWGYLFLHERPSWVTLTGGGLIAGVTAFSSLK